MEANKNNKGSHELNQSLINTIEKDKKAMPQLSGVKRKREDDNPNSMTSEKNKRQKTSVLNSMLRYDSDSDNSSDSDSNSSDSSEYDFIKAAKQNAAKPSKLLVDQENEQKKQNYNNNVNKVIDDSNTVARELFSILPDANYSKGDQILSISGTLRLKKDVQVVDIISTKKAAADKNNEDRKDYEED